MQSEVRSSSTHRNVCHAEPIAHFWLRRVHRATTGRLLLRPQRIELTEHDIGALRKEGRILAVRDRNQINEFASGLAAHEISNEFSKFSEATRLFGKYFYVKSHMLDCVGDFIERNFDRFGQLGMHYRGTDHHSEYEFIDQHMMVDAATEHFPQYEFLFVATDEKRFLDLVRSHMTSKRVVTFMPEPAKPQLDRSGR